jgi:hypothetical protein
MSTEFDNFSLEIFQDFFILRLKPPSPTHTSPKSHAREEYTMLKGAQKRMIVVRTTDSKLFEEAYFVMRHDACHGGQTDMLQEANRILEMSLRSERRERRPRCLRELLWGAAGLGVGMLLGGGGVGLVWLLL